MADKKNLCAQIDTALHARVRQEQERSGMTLSEYVEQLIQNYYNMKETTKMTGDKRRQSTQQLMGIKKITDYCISTDAGDLVFYIIKPTNISVLPSGAVSAKIRALQNTLSAQAGVELLAMNSRESFNATCLFYHDRMQEEQNPAIRELLEQDRAFLDEKQVQMTLAREFYLAVRLKNEKPDTAYTLLSTIETKFRDNGFTTRRAGKEDLKRLLAIYFEQNTTTERFEDYDGQRFLEVI